MRLGLQESLYALKTWMERSGCKMRSMTLTFSFTDPAAAAVFDQVLHEEFLEHMPYVRLEPGPIREFELMGLKVKVDSPLHREPARFVVWRGRPVE